MKLYKYTSAKYALEFLRTRELKVTTILDANDPDEWTPCILSPAGQNRLQEPMNRYLWETHYANKYGFISFSECPNNTLMWAHYGDRFRGMALAFETKIGLPDPRLTQVCYPKGNLRLVIDPDSIRQANDETANNIVGRKGSVWAYEKEWRLIVDIAQCRYIGFAEGHPILTQTVDPLLDLCGLILGAECPIANEQALTVLENWQDHDRDIAINRLVADDKTFSYNVQPVCVLSKKKQQ